MQNHRIIATSVLENLVQNYETTELQNWRTTGRTNTETQ